MRRILVLALALSACGSPTEPDPLVIESFELSAPDTAIDGAFPFDLRPLVSNITDANGEVIARDSIPWTAVRWSWTYKGQDGREEYGWTTRAPLPFEWSVRMTLRVWIAGAGPESVEALVLYKSVRL